MPRLLTSAVAVAAITLAAGAALAQPAAPSTAPAAPPPAAPPPAAAPSLQLNPSGDIVETLKANGHFTTLLKALDASNLTSFLKGAGPFTVLAPTDEAFAALPPGQLDGLMKNAAQLQALLAYHLIAAGLPPSKIQGAKSPVATAAGANVLIDGTASPFKINGANVLGQAQVSNGDVYAVDKVLAPQQATAAASTATNASATTPAR